MNKYAIFGIIVVVAVFLDLWTKTIAENNLASVSSRWEHTLEVTVDGVPAEGTTLGEWLESEYGEGSTTSDPPRVRGVYVVDDAGSRSGPMPMSRPIYEGDQLSISHRQVEIVPGFWNHVYVQNFGAAWGFLSRGDSAFVRPFFLIVSIVAVFIVLRIFRGVRDDQKLLMVALSLIVGGAIGNFVDRARYGYVVDFIDWYVTTGGQERHWPTFNVADVWITIGVGLMIIEIIFGDHDADEGDAVAVDDADTVAA